MTDDLGEGAEPRPRRRLGRRADFTHDELMRAAAEIAAAVRKRAGLAPGHPLEENAAFLLCLMRARRLGIDGMRLLPIAREAFFQERLAEGPPAADDFADGILGYCLSRPGDSPEWFGRRGCLRIRIWGIGPAVNGLIAFILYLFLAVIVVTLRQSIYIFATEILPEWVSVGTVVASTLLFVSWILLYYSFAKGRRERMQRALRRQAGQRAYGVLWRAAPPMTRLEVAKTHTKSGCRRGCLGGAYFLVALVIFFFATYLFDIVFGDHDMLLACYLITVLAGLFVLPIRLTEDPEFMEDLHPDFRLMIAHLIVRWRAAGYEERLT